MDRGLHFRRTLYKPGLWWCDCQSCREKRDAAKWLRSRTGAKHGHARNTYGWDCDEIISRELVPGADYFIVTRSSGLQLRVYLRPDQHPRITNMDGGYA